MSRVLFVVAFVLCTLSSCGNKTERIKSIDFSKTPRQVAENMYAKQSTNGRESMRLEATRMEKYDYDSVSVEYFTKGFDVFSYNEEGDLETHISSHGARHSTWKSGEEKWMAYGNVVITNYIKGERMLTDTLYWDRHKSEIYTNCLVKMSSQRGFIQGYGMRSDEMARNAEILRPFDSYSLIGEDSVINKYEDTANIVGPRYMPPKERDLRVEGKE